MIKNNLPNSLRQFFSFIALSLFICCKQTDNNRSGAGPGGKEESLMKLQLNPPAGSVFKYEIVNESDVRTEVQDKEVTNINRTTVVINYAVNRDSAGNYLFNTTYDKLKFYIKKNDQESELDAANAANTFDPVEKMLGLLKQSEITTTVSPDGEMKSVSGYQQLTDKVMAAFNTADANTRQMAKSRWEQFIEEGVMKKSMEQLFSMFPDSAVQVGDKWTMQTTQKGEVSMRVTTTYTLKEITDGKATISSESNLSKDPSSASVMGFPLAGELNGHQTGESKIDIKTGMLVSSKITVTIKCNLQVMGMDVPIVIKNKITMQQR